MLTDGTAGAYTIGGVDIEEIGFAVVTTVTVAPPSSTGIFPRTPPITLMLDIVITLIGAFPRFGFLEWQ